MKNRRRKKRKPNRKRPLNLVACPLVLSNSNDELAGVMHRCKALRKNADRDSIVLCTVDGFDDDPRCLGEIPEVRAFCRRLVGMGFISYLDVSSGIKELAHPTVAQGGGMGLGLGALEVWLIAEGLLGKAGRVNLDGAAWDRFRAALDLANQQADATCGK
jgi:hypothetical protein